MLRRVWLSLEIKMCDDKSLYSQYAHGFRSGTPMKLLGSLNSSMWCELETNPLRQRLHAGVAASKHLSCHPCVVFCDMYQGVLIFFFLKADKMEGTDEFIRHTYALNRAQEGHTQQTRLLKSWGYIKTCSDNIFIVAFASVSAYLTVKAKFQDWAAFSPLDHFCIDCIL